MSQSKSKQRNPLGFTSALIASALLYTAFSLFVFPGYRIEQEDQRYYIPPIKQNIDSELYQRDFFMSASQAEASLFDEFVKTAALGREENIYLVFFWGTVVSRLLFFAGISLLAFAFSRNAIFSLLIPLIFLIGHDPGTTNVFPLKYWLFSFDTEFHPRCLTIPLSIFALGAFFLKRHWIAWILLSIGLLIHPITAIPVLIFLGISTLSSEIIPKKHFRYALWYLFPLSALGLLLSAMSGSEIAGIGLFDRIDEAWRVFSEEWTPWMFFKNQLGSVHLLGIYLPLLLFFLMAVLSSSLRENLRHKLVILFGSMWLLAVFGIVAFDILGYMFPGQLQLHRGIQVLAVVMPIAALSVFFQNIVEPKTSSFQKGIFGLAFLVIALGGKAVYMPFAIALFFVALYLIAAKYFKNHRLMVAGFTAICLGCVTAALFQPLAQSQFALLAEFARQIFHDPVLSFGLLTLWLLPIAAVTALLLTILVFQQKHHFSRRFFLGSLLITGILAGGIFGWHLSEYREFVSPRNRVETALSGWTKDNISKNDLVYVSIRAEDIGLHLRNHFGKSVFVTNFGQSQGTFNRPYAMEWLKRRELRLEPRRHWNELQDYDIDYFIFEKNEFLPPLPVVFEGDRFLVMKNSRE